MALFFEFFAQEWALFTILLMLIFIFFLFESHKSGTVISTNQLTTLINQQQGIIVDVRESKDFRTGHIVDAVNIPYIGFSDRMGELESHKDKPVILICKIGQHSGAAAHMLKKAGFTQVYRLSGGISEWKNSELPVVKD